MTGVSITKGGGGKDEEGGGGEDEEGGGGEKDAAKNEVRFSKIAFNGKN